jgi:hypothetical protein
MDEEDGSAVSDGLPVSATRRGLSNPGPCGVLIYRVSRVAQQGNNPFEKRENQAKYPAWRNEFRCLL